MSQLVFNQLKQQNFNNLSVTLALVRQYKKDRETRYTISYIPIEENLSRRLKAIITDTLNCKNVTDEYTFDCSDPEGDRVLSIDFNITGFKSIYDKLITLNSEEDIIENVDELLRSKAYMIILSSDQGIKAIGYRTLPENWKMKRAKGLTYIFYNGVSFSDLEEQNIFSISSTLDFIYFNEILFINSKRNFEHGLDFRNGLMDMAQNAYIELRNMNRFTNIELLVQKVGNNQHYLRKIANIKNSAYYQDNQYLDKLIALVRRKGWNIQIQDSNIVFSEDTIDVVLSLLQNKRLFSELTEQDFDVDNPKVVSIK